MTNLFKLTVLIVTLTLSTKSVTAQSTNLCEGVKYIHSHLTKANFEKLPEDYASRIAGWKPVGKEVGEYSNFYTLEYEIKKAGDVDAAFKKLNDQLVSCLDVKPEIEGEGPGISATFHYKEGAIMTYQSWSKEGQWIMIAVFR